ncbi:hypothetical protein AAMO2058_001603400 [Amorphochlora amoebiformis]
MASARNFHRVVCFHNPHKLYDRLRSRLYSRFHRRLNRFHSKFPSSSSGVGHVQPTGLKSFAKESSKRLSPRITGWVQLARFSQWKFQPRRPLRSTAKEAAKWALTTFAIFGITAVVVFTDKLWIVSKLDPENAHLVSVWAASLPQCIRWMAGLIETYDTVNIPELTTDLCGMTLSNCVGLAAGFDKNGECMTGMLDMGFGFVELGTVTPLPQKGNPQPRVFRLKDQAAVINRYGFNSDGHDRVRMRLESMSENAMDFRPGRIIGVNIGKNKTSKDHVGDYVKGVTCLGGFADYLVVNVSSPNTPGLRDLQGEKYLGELLTAVMKARDALPTRPKVDYKKRKDQRLAKWNKGLQYWMGFYLYDPETVSYSDVKRPALPPVFVKIAPDVDKQGLEAIAKVVMETGVDGIVISNTTIKRDFGWEHPNLHEKGGLSGRPVKGMSTRVISDFYRLTDGKVPIVGVGGIESGKDAFDKIAAGASAVQLYTGLIYRGPRMVPEIKAELALILAEKGYKNVAEAVGEAHRKT